VPPRGRADGSLTGFGGGLAIKRRLLDLEAGLIRDLWDGSPIETAAEFRT
jgi:hypothetical protein